MKYVCSVCGWEYEVSLRGALNQTSEAQMDALVAELCAE